MKAGQGNQQYRQQAGAQQREDLGSQGFLQHGLILMTGLRCAGLGVKKTSKLPCLWFWLAAVAAQAIPVSSAC